MAHSARAAPCCPAGVHELVYTDPEKPTSRELSLEAPRCCRTPHAMVRRRPRARGPQARRDERHSRADDARARPPSRARAWRALEAAAAGAAARQLRARDLAGAARRAPRLLRGRGRRAALGPADRLGPRPPRDWRHGGALAPPAR